MVKVPKDHANKIKKQESRNRVIRGKELGERKLACPFYSKNNLTYRKIIQHHGLEGVVDRCRIGIMCLVEGCPCMCTDSLLCLFKHLKAYHGGDKQTPYGLCPVAISDISYHPNGSNHMEQCLSLVKQTIDKNKKEKKEAKVKARKAKTALFFKNIKDTEKEAKEEANKKETEIKAEIARKVKSSLFFKNFRKMEKCLILEEKRNRTKGI